MASMGVT